MDVFEATSGFSAISMKAVLFAIVFLLLTLFSVISYVRTKTIPKGILRLAVVLIALFVLLEITRLTV